MRSAVPYRGPYVEGPYVEADTAAYDDAASHGWFQPAQDAPPPGPMPEPRRDVFSHDPRFPDPPADWRSPIDPFGGPTMEHALPTPYPTAVDQPTAEQWASEQWASGQGTSEQGTSEQGTSGQGASTQWASEQWEADRRAMGDWTAAHQPVAQWSPEHWTDERFEERYAGDRPTAEQPWVDPAAAPVAARPLTRRERREQLARLHGEDADTVLQSQYVYQRPENVTPHRRHAHEAHRQSVQVPAPPRPGPGEGVIPADATEEFTALAAALARSGEREAQREAQPFIVPTPPRRGLTLGNGWSRKTHVAVRAFAVGLLVVAVGAGVATQLDRSDPDTVEVSNKFEALPPEQSITTPGPDTRESQGEQVGAELLQHSRQQAQLASAKRAAQQKAKAAQTAGNATVERAADSRASRGTARDASAGDGNSEGNGTGDVADNGPSGEEAPAAPVSCQSYDGNKQSGCSLLSWAGFGTDQMSCLDKLWTKESHWNPTAENNSSGAYGIPQALPASKMAPYGADYRTNPVPQIKWGLNYIKGRYGSPCNAWAHSQNTGWY